jgi:hypothetical protein
LTPIQIGCDFRREIGHKYYVFWAEVNSSYRSDLMHTLT